MGIGKVNFVYRADNKRQEYKFEKDISNEDISVVIQRNYENDGQRTIIKIVPKKKIEIERLVLETDFSFCKDDSVFVNGYQTWTDSREFKLHERIPRLSSLVRPIMSMYGDYDFVKEKNVLTSWTYTYFKIDKNIVFMGSLSESYGYTKFVYEKDKMKIVKDCSGLVIDSQYEAFDIFEVEGEENYCFNRYFDKMKLPKPRAAHCTGWTSWYNYYTNISEDIIMDNLSSFRSRSIPLDIFQIDDGYQEHVGDWLKVNSKFPKGMGYIANEIKNAGYKAGIWLAPFICEKKSEIYKKHPEWIIKKAGFNPGWSGMFYVLDFYNEEVRDYIRNVFNTVFNDWGYDMVKLDFLYSAALIERKDKTRGQIMFEAMQFLRELAGNKLILGCGVPLGCSFGLTDYCRIGSDVALKWEDSLLKRLHYRERVSTINSLTSTIGRRHLNGRAFLNDPDVFILRSKGVELNTKQRYTLLLLNLIFGGLVFTSDNIDEYSDEELKLYKSIFPIKEKQIKQVVSNNILKIIFAMDEKEYMALCNLNDRKQTYILQDGKYYSREVGLIEKESTIKLEPFESVCLIKTDSVSDKIANSNNIFML